MTQRFVPLVILLASGCGPSLTSPSPAQQSRVEEARAMILSSTERMPFSSETVGQWFRSRVTGIYIDDGHPEWEAYRKDDRVYISSTTAKFSLVELTGVLMHEARHADVRHTCGLSDRSVEEWGAWAVQAWWLDQHSYSPAADLIRQQYICH